MLTSKARKWLFYPPLPYLTLPLEGGPSEFRDKTYPAIWMYGAIRMVKIS